MSNKLGPLLLQAGLISQQDLEACVEQARVRNVSLWELLIEEKKVSEESVAETFAKWLRLPQVKLASATVEPDAARIITEELARRYMCLPLQVEGKWLTLAMANPADYNAIQDIEFASGLRVKPVVTTRTEILDAIDNYYKPEDQLRDFLGNVADASDLRIEAPETEVDLDTMDSKAAAELPPVVKMCNVVIQDAVKMGASDIHVEPGASTILVRFRVDGMLREYMQVPKWLHAAVVSRLKILSKLDIAERRVPQDGRIKVQMKGKTIDLRVSTLPTHLGEKVVMRLLGSATVPSFAQMGLNEGQVGSLENALNQPQGLILVTGPTGSGKSSTLYSCLNRRKSPEVNIITVEDPVEYQLAGITQVQVNTKAGLTFASALRSILRQDPDVVLVGEIRDLETAEVCFHAAMTGHLVLSTLHTNSSLATVARLLDLGVDPFMIASSLNLIIAQRLCRRVCLKCQEPYTPSSNLVERLRLDEAGTVFYRGRGCGNCGNTGYAGRVGIYEVLRITPSLRELIQKKASEDDMRKVAGLAGTKFLLEDALEKVRSGVTTLEEVLRVIQLQEADIIRCPNCSAFINLAFAACPYCLHVLKHLCRSCGQELKLEWKICPYCNARTSFDVADSVVARKPAQLPGGTATATSAAAAGAAPSPPASPRELPSEESVEVLQLDEEPESAAPAPPAAPRPAASPRPVMPSVAVAESESDGGPRKPRILVVDDDDGIRKVVVKTLAQLPVETEIKTASDGAEALEIMESYIPDLVILDVMMPRMDGFTVCQRLREEVRTAFVPVMMLTANADENSRTHGYLVGTDDYLGKPFSIPEFNARVMRLLRRTYGI